MFDLQPEPKSYGLASMVYFAISHAIRPFNPGRTVLYLVEDGFRLDRTMGVKVSLFPDQTFYVSLDPDWIKLDIAQFYAAIVESFYEVVSAYHTLRAVAVDDHIVLGAN